MSQGGHTWSSIYGHASKLSVEVICHEDLPLCVHLNAMLAAPHFWRVAADDYVGVYYLVTLAINYASEYV